MKPKKTTDNIVQPIAPQEIHRGEIKDSHLKALVTSQAFRPQVVKAKKGKGSYQRKVKHNRREAFFMAA